MATDFIYLLSSLPLLKLSGEGATTYSAFLDSCAAALSPKEHALLEGLTLQGTPGVIRTEPPELAQWDRWMECMTQIAAIWRAARRHQETPADWRPAREIAPGDVRRLEEALSLKTLWEKQEAWEALQWSHLEELSLAAGYSFGAVVVHALKLRLLEGRLRRSQEEGTRVFEETVAHRLEEATRWRQTVEE